MPFFKNLEIPLPSVDEQKEIAQILFSVDQKIAKEKLCKDRLLVLKNGLMSDIFSQKVHIQV
jgi:type I restriction enzyme S subunit